MKERRNTGITLIALVITIIIMLILAGIIIAELTGKNGLITKAGLVKARTEYENAKEEVNIKLMEIATDCEERGVEYSINEIYNAIEKDDEKTIEKIFNKKTGVVDLVAQESIVDLSDIVVSVKKYSKYKFLVGNKEETSEIEGIKGVTTEKITNFTTIEDFKSVVEFEKTELKVYETIVYSVTFDANGGTGNMKSKEAIKGTKYKIPENEFTAPSSCVFEGWYENAEGTGDKHEPGEIIKITGNIELYAKWKNIWTIEYYANDGTENKTTVEVDRGQSTQILGDTALKKDNSVLVSWNTEINGSGTKYTLGDSVTPTENIKLYAQWETTTWSTKGVSIYSSRVSITEGGYYKAGNGITYVNMTIMAKKNVSWTAWGILLYGLPKVSKNFTVMDTSGVDSFEVGHMSSSNYSNAIYIYNSGITSGQTWTLNFQY